MITWQQRAPDLTEAVRAAIHDAMLSVWTALPGIIHDVDLTRQTVSVQPAVQGQVPDAEGKLKDVSLPILGDVPIVWPRGGGFALTFPVKQGDECLVVFSSRCIDGWWHDGGSKPSEDDRILDLSDGFAILAPCSQPRKLDKVSSSAVQLRNDDGSAYVQITAQKELVAKVDEKYARVKGDSITLSGDEGKNYISVTGDALDFRCAGTVSIRANTINIAGRVNVNGSLTQSNGALTTNGIDLGTHVHISSSPGNPTSPPR